MLHRIIFLPAVLVGIVIAYVDSRPNWDDTGVTALSLLISAAVLTTLAPQIPWLVALCVGIWIPAYAIARTPSAGSLAMLVVLLFPLMGAYIGMAIRRFIFPPVG
jgi:uncharacterized membrane protein